MRLKVESSHYNVILKFAELYFKHTNQRVFNVAINGAPVINHLDLVASAGYGVAHDLTIPVVVTNGSISIVFTSIVNNAKVNGIEIVPGL